MMMIIILLSCDICIFSDNYSTNPCAVNNGGCAELCLFNGSSVNCQCSHGRKVNETQCKGVYLDIIATIKINLKSQIVKTFIRKIILMSSKASSIVIC